MVEVINSNYITITLRCLCSCSDNYKGQSGLHNETILKNQIRILKSFICPNIILILPCVLLSLRKVLGNPFRSTLTQWMCTRFSLKDFVPRQGTFTLHLCSQGRRWWEREERRGHIRYLAGFIYIGF